MSRPAERFAGLGHPLRLEILHLLAEHPASGSELARRLQRSPGTVAYHVGVLERAGLIQIVSTRRIRAVTERLFGITNVAEDLLAPAATADDEDDSRPAVRGAPDGWTPGPAIEAASSPRPRVELPAPSQAGILRFIHYAFMPNRLGYCGPDDNRRLFDHGVAGEADRALVPALTRFLGPMPYLRAIAAGAGIRDPFDDRVVEAYWIGNDLLDRYASRALYDALRERFRRELPPKVMDLIADQIPAGALPHHCFHVFDVWLRVGRLDGNVVCTLDHCRISWGTVASVDGATVALDRPPLQLSEGKLALGTPERVYVTHLVDGKGFVSVVSPGDQVSVHWGWVCERLSPAQVGSLARYTDHHIRLANRKL
jgi:DNA-binding transcriptional ArsR family regulator